MEELIRTADEKVITSMIELDRILDDVDYFKNKLKQALRGRNVIEVVVELDSKR